MSANDENIDPPAPEANQEVADKTVETEVPDDSATTMPQPVLSYANIPPTPMQFGDTKYNAGPIKQVGRFVLFGSANEAGVRDPEAKSDIEGSTYSAIALSSQVFINAERPVDPQNVVGVFDKLKVKSSVVVLVAIFEDGEGEVQFICSNEGTPVILSPKNSKIALSRPPSSRPP